MKYQNEILIKLPREEVFQKFNNQDNMKHWQKGFMGLEHISGDPGKEGAKSKLRYKMGKREIEMTESILKLQAPEEFHGTFETQGVYNKQENFFEVVDENTTKWVSKTEFRFSTFMMKTMAFLMPGSFKKQSYKFMVDFKNFAENGTSVADA
ncbi:SRPBCC family protein [Leptobacterium flavescens]|uniref:SRPBCC family protein n=1 Tax=Leptobacterium flavescens TaxID=472055 RepID=A0A6P0UQ95_9FLAO|nr:SRPBCC family protein [Leptobacterium flavescens]NER15534.1 SRPBCC family protein [Leptobacterium flavescens]